MKCILLAAGYATRLYPLTKDKPKSLLDVAGKTILEHILQKVERVSEIDEIVIVTNDRFYQLFQDWVKQYVSSKTIKVLNDYTTNNDNRLGAVADIQYVIAEEHINDDVLVMAGDNLFDFELADFVSFFHQRHADCITVHELEDLDALRRTGVATVDSQGKVLHFEEKPQVPRSNLAVPPFYIYKKESLPLFRQYLEEGNNPDAPGHFIPWLITRTVVYAYSFSGHRYDVGTHDSYREVQEIFSQKKS